MYIYSVYIVCIYICIHTIYMYVVCVYILYSMYIHSIYMNIIVCVYKNIIIVCIYIYTYIHIALWHVWIEPDSLDLASMKAYMCRYLYIHFIIVCISAYAAPDVHARNLRSTQLYSCWSLQKPIRNPWKSADLCPYVYLVGGFNPSEKYESQWEGLSHILWKI